MPRAVRLKALLINNISNKTVGNLKVYSFIFEENLMFE